MMIVINPKYENLREWLETIPEHFEHTGEVIYDARNQIRIIPLPDGTKVCVKRFHAPRFLNRYIYRYFRPSKAQRAYYNALTLLERGVATPEPLAYILCGKHLLNESYLITRYSSLTRTFYEFGDGVTEGKEDILRAFARYTAAAHEAKIYHRDYSPGNILFDRIDKTWHFEMVDINRLEIDKPVSMQQGCSSFARLWGRQALHEIIIDEYAKARGWNGATCRQIALQARDRFWRHRNHSFFRYD